MTRTRATARDRELAKRLQKDPTTAPLIAADAVIVAYVELTVAIAGLEHRIEHLTTLMSAHLGAAPRKARKR